MEPVGAVGLEQKHGQGRPTSPSHRVKQMDFKGSAFNRVQGRQRWPFLSSDQDTFTVVPTHNQALPFE